MDVMNDKLLRKVEKALDIKFFDWQKDYILDIPRLLDMRMTGRRTGKTLVYIVKLLFAEDKPLNAFDIKEVSRYSDWFCISDRIDRKDTTYTQWFRRFLMDIYNTLTDKGLKPRPVFFNRNEYDLYYSLYR